MSRLYYNVVVYAQTTAVNKIAALRARIRAVQGGSSAGKSVGILMLLIQHAILPKSVCPPVVISIVSESLPHLKKGMMRVFLDVMQTHGYFREEEWNKTDFIYTFKTGSKIEFFSVDQPDKVRGPRRDVLFINEANNISFETFEQLEIRTNEYIFLDWNPTNLFWFNEHVCACKTLGCFGKRMDIEHIVLTYKDNEALPQNVRDALEQRKDRAGWWKVYGEGLLGEVEGRIYYGWQVINGVPFEARLERYGIDFGWTKSVSTIIALYYYNGGYILDEIFYEEGAKNRDIANFLRNQPKALVIADSAEPKSIEELRDFGIRIVPAIKGKDSKKFGIKAMQAQKISVTRSSSNLLKEYRNYLTATDANGATIEDETDGDDDCLDAARYAMTSLIPVIRRKELQTSWTPPPRKKANVAV